MNLNIISLAFQWRPKWCEALIVADFNVAQHHSVMFSKRSAPVELCTSVWAAQELETLFRLVEIQLAFRYRPAQRFRCEWVAVPTLHIKHMCRNAG